MLPTPAGTKERLDEFERRVGERDLPTLHSVPLDSGLRKVLPDDCIYAIDRWLAADACEFSLWPAAIILSDVIGYSKPRCEAASCWRNGFQVLRMHLERVNHNVGVERFPYERWTPTRALRRFQKEERHRAWDRHNGWTRRSRLADALDLATRVERDAEAERKLVEEYEKKS